jgi:hypothetical protein
MSSTSSDELDHTGSEHQFTVIAKAETKDVARLRWVVAAVLICSAVGVAVSANYYIKNSEASQFRTRFEDDSEKVLQAIGSR